MDSFEFNSIKAEKARAMRNYNRQKVLKNFELFMALALLAWSSYNYIPVTAAAAAKVSADFLRRNVAVLSQPLYVFLAVNILIVVISVLSSTQKPTKRDLYDDYVTIAKANASRRSSTSAADDDQKQIVCVDDDKAVKKSPAEQNTVDASTKAAITTTTTTKTTAVKDIEPVRPVQESTVSEVKEYKRSRSERLDRRGKGNRREKMMMMRRSETLIKSSTEDVKEGRRSSDSEMDELSSEEFRMTIDSFIAAKKKSLIKENTLDLSSFK